MDRQLWPKVKAGHIEWFLTTSSILIILVELFFYVSGTYNDMIAKTYLFPLVAVMIALVWIRRGIPKDAETLLAIAFALWFFATRMLNSDKSLQDSPTYIVMIFLGCLVLFPLPSVLDAKGRKKLITSIALAYTTIMGVIAYIGLFALLTNNPIVSPFIKGPIEHTIFGAEPGPERLLRFFIASSNMVACLLYIALSMIFYLFISHKRLMPRLWYAVLGLGICLGIYFTGSTTGIVITILMWLMLMFVVFLNRRKVSRKWIVAISIAVIFTLALAVAGGLFLKGILEDKTLQNGVEVSYWSRSINLDVTFNGRTKIWEAGTAILKARPLSLFIGELHHSALYRLYMAYGVYLPHVHNAFLETVILGGLPALILGLVFSVFLFIRMVQLFFNKQAPLASKILILPLVGLFLHAVTENYIYIFDELPNYFFFLFSGLVVFESKACRIA